MTEYNPAEYTFLGLDNHGKPSGGPTTLAYLVSLVDSPAHEVVNPRSASGILTLLFDTEEQLRTPSELASWQQKRLPQHFHPVTPCMLTKAWSPIGAMLQQGFEPLILSRQPKSRALATGIWNPVPFRSEQEFADCETPEQLFWSILGQAFQKADERSMLINIIAKPGWWYDMKIGVLPKWSKEDLMIANKILWARMPEDFTS